MKSAKTNNLSALVLKAMGIFGGVQVFSILCSIVRTKLISTWIGATGVGLFGLYNTAIEMIASITQLGIRNSAVRDLATSDNDIRNSIIKVIRRWAWVLGIFGAITTFSLSPILSQWTFGDDQHSWGFIALSIVLLLSSITGGELAILQGTERLHALARASIWGAIGGLAISIPLFYYLHIDSIIPSIIAYSLLTCIAAICYRYKSPSPPVTIGWKETAHMGQGFIVLGIFMTISSFAVNVGSYIFMSYLNNRYGTETVGHYQAGFTIVNRYVGLVFAAIAMEYYPRLTRVNGKRRRERLFVSHEMTIALLILIPCVTILIATRQIVIVLLYSHDFLVISNYVAWALVGTFLRAVCWCMAFVILARGDGKVYMASEIGSVVIMLLFNIAGYELWGLDGLGYSYIAWFAAYTAIIASIYTFRYRLSLPKRLIALVAISLSIGWLSVISSQTLPWFGVIIAITTTLSSGYYLKKLIVKH